MKIESRHYCKINNTASKSTDYVLASDFMGNGQSLLLCWYFIMSSPEPLLIEKLMMKITTKADRIPSAGYGLIAI
jgi:hypothetical protein